MYNEVVNNLRILKLKSIEHLEGRDLSQVVRNKNSTDFVIEKLLLNTENRRARVTVVYKGRNGVFVSEAIEILLEIKLVSVELFC